MKPIDLLEKLEAAAALLNVKVSYEAIGATVGSGGLCRVRGAYRVIIDKRTSPSERVGVLAQSLSALVPLQTGGETDAELDPAVRDALAFYSIPRAS